MGPVSRMGPAAELTLDEVIDGINRERLAIPVGYYIGMLFVSFLVAAFLAWSEEQKKPPS